MILLIDNYDSFSYNLVQFLERLSRISKWSAMMNVPLMKFGR